MSDGKKKPVAAKATEFSHSHNILDMLSALNTTTTTTTTIFQEQAALVLSLRYVVFVVAVVVVVITAGKRTKDTGTAIQLPEKMVASPL